MSDMQPVDVKIEKHSTIDKSFEILFPYLAVYANYDDVNHAEVDAAAEVVKSIVDKYWNEDLFKEKLKERVLKEWQENENNIQEDYFTEGGFDGFLRDRGLVK